MVVINVFQNQLSEASSLTVTDLAAGGKKERRKKKKKRLEQVVVLGCDVRAHGILPIKNAFSIDFKVQPPKRHYHCK